MTKIKNKTVERWKKGVCGERQMDLKEFENRKKVEENVRKTYPQDWKSYNPAKMQERLIVEELLLELLENLQEKPSWIKSPFTINDKIFIMWLYCYLGKSSRGTVAEVEIARRRNLISRACHFNSILNMFRDSSLTKTLLNLVEISALPLRQFEESASVDATGFSINNFSRWFDIRTKEDSKKRDWLKLNIISGNKTNIVISLIVSEGTAGDSPALIPLVKSAGRNFQLKDVCADKAYLSRNNLNAIAGIGATPFIPFKSNSKENARGCRLWKLMYQFCHDNKEEFDRHYHQRSKIESTIWMIKKNYRNSIKTKTFTSQINELLVKCLCHNLAVLVQESFELGLTIDFKECFESYVAQAESL